MLALARIHVLVEIGTVELRERMCVLREMRRHPVHDHAYPSLMTSVDEVTEIVGRPEPARGRVIIRDLITPRALERVLRNWQQLYVGEAHLQHVWQQRVSEL